MASTRILTSIKKLKTPSSSLLFMNRLNPAATVSATATTADSEFSRKLFSPIRPDEVIRQQSMYQSLLGKAMRNDDDRFRINVRGERVVIDDGEDFLGDSEDDSDGRDCDSDFDDVYDGDDFDEDDDEEEKKRAN